MSDNATTDAKITLASSLKLLKEITENKDVTDALATKGLAIDYVALNKAIHDTTNAPSWNWMPLTTLEQDIDNLNAQFDSLRLTMVNILRRIAREKSGHAFPYTVPSIPYMPVIPNFPNTSPQWEYQPMTPKIICSGGTIEKQGTAVCINQADGCSDPGDVHVP